MTVIGFELESRSPVANGAPFGDYGPYEELSGTLRFAIDPLADVNQGIAGLQSLPTDPSGFVTFESDLVITVPVASDQSQRLLIDVANRGRPSAWRWLNSAVGYPAPSKDDVGNGFLLRHGFTVARCGWQLDLPAEAGRVQLRTAHSPEAYPSMSAGPILVQIETDQPANSLRLSHRDHRAYPVSPEHTSASMTVRPHDGAARVEVPRHLWSFARDDNGTPIPDLEHVWLTGGFQAGLIYEVTYTATNPTVIGLGLLAVRDMTSWLCHSGVMDGNPMANRFDYALGHGESQAARFLREFLFLGLNEDEQGRAVFDGLLIAVPGARRGEFNIQFGQPSKTTSEDVGATYPFHDEALHDRITDKQQGLLDRLSAKGRAPKVITFNTATEYWGGDRDAGGQASLLHIDPSTLEDADPPSTSRVYLISGAQHVPQEFPTSTVTHRGTLCQQLICSLDHQPFSRALLMALDRWVVTGESPPPSRVPRMEDQTAIAPEQAVIELGAIPGFAIPAHLPTLHGLDFRSGHGGEPRLPPVRTDRYPHFVSSLDRDGNETAGIRHPDVAAPLATYVGLNVRATRHGGLSTLVPAAGAMYPFAATAAERLATGDSRLSLKERYADETAYLSELRAAADALVAERLLLAEDVGRIVEAARAKFRAFTTSHSEWPPTSPGTDADHTSNPAP